MIKRMKSGSKLILTIAVLVFFVWGLSVYRPELLKFGSIFKNFFWSQCDFPIGYYVGSVDPRFGITKTQLETILKRAEDIWEEPLGTDIFEMLGQPDRNAIAVNMIFDERQETINRYLAQNQLGRQYEALVGQYNDRLEALEVAAAKYNSQLRDFNAAVAAWNKRPGQRTDSRYRELVAEQERLRELEKDLRQEADNLETLRVELNRTRDILVAQNAQLKVLWERHFAGKPSGLYQVGTASGVINVYAMQNIQELTITLAHELGHTVIEGHATETPAAIMYPSSNPEQVKLTDADIALFTSRCPITTK